MKPFSVLFLAIITLALFDSCHLKAKRAKVYHDDLLKSVQAVIDSSLDYGDAIQSYEKTKALQAHSKYTTLVNNKLQHVKQAGNFSGDTILQHYSLEILGFYKNTLEQKIGPVLNSVQNETFSDEQKQQVDSLYQDLAITESKYWARFEWAEKKFYRENGIEVVEK